MFIFIKNIFPEVPDGQEREPNKETQRSPHLGNEGDGRVRPDLLFQPGFRVIKAGDQQEIFFISLSIFRGDSPLRIFDHFVFLG